LPEKIIKDNNKIIDGNKEYEKFIGSGDKF